MSQRSHLHPEEYDYRTPRLDVLTVEEIREATEQANAAWEKKWKLAQERRQRELAEISRRFPLTKSEARGIGEGAILVEAKRIQRWDDEEEQERNERNFRQDI